MFIAVLFIIIKNWKLSKWPSGGRWVNKLLGSKKKKE
jgi:hypothetical protein